MIETRFTGPVLLQRIYRRLFNDETAVAVTVEDSHAGPEGRGGEGKKVAVGVASTASGAINATLVDVVFIPDAGTTLGCFIQIGFAPEAVIDNDYYLAANKPMRFPITSGNKIAAIQDTAGGKLRISPVE